MTSDPVDIVNIFLEEFTPKKLQLGSAKFENKTSFNSMFFLPVREEEVVKEINFLGSSSAVGSDGVTIKALKHVATYISKPLSHCINLFFEHGTYPDSMKHSIIRPLHKKGTRTEAGNYRGIFLVSNIAKLIDKLVHKRLQIFLETYNLISKDQHGFTQGKSTTTSTADLLHEIVSGFAAGNISLVIFVDFTKAFDSCCHSLLLSKLETLGVRGTCLQFFKSYLSNRTQSVLYKYHEQRKSEIEVNVQESRTAVDTGVFAGTILGPALFNIFINSLFECLNDVKTTAYADDIAIVLNAPDCNALERTATKVMGKLVSWSSENGLRINTSKTKFMLFNNKSATIFNLMLNGESLECVKIFKYLGISIEEKLCWSTHIDELCHRLQRILKLFRFLRHSFLFCLF